MITLTSGCSKKSDGTFTSSEVFQIGLLILTVGQLSFCSHCISHPIALDSWIIEKYGAIASKSNSVISVAASLAFSSADLHASGKGASTKSIISTVATDVGLAIGGRSTSFLFNAARTLSFFVIFSIIFP